jgi:hypothetical protein
MSSNHGSPFTLVPMSELVSRDRPSWVTSFAARIEPSAFAINIKS